MVGTKKIKLSLPHVYTLALILIIITAALTWILPSGEFQHHTINTAAGEREVAIAGTYEQVDKVSEDGSDLRQGLAEILMAPTIGIQRAAAVVAFILLLGGTFKIIEKTNALNAGMQRIVKKLKGRDLLIIPIVMILFGIAGSTYGMSEEVLPFYMLLLPIFMKMGYDSMTAFMVCFLGPQVGYAASTINPFSVLIAQAVAGIPGNPQLGFRFIQWIIFMIITIVFVMWYARKVKKDPEISITYEDDFKKREEFLDSHVDNYDFTFRHKLILAIFAGGLGLIIFGLLKYGWYMNEISMVFLGIGILAGIVGGLKEKEMAVEFVAGVKEFAYAAIIVGVCRGILVIAEDGMIIDTILNALANMLGNVPSYIFTSVMYISQSIIAFLVPSSSAQAALTMPVMGPLADLVGANPESAVTVLQYSNMFTNMLSPTAGMTVAGLAVCKISFGQWWKTIWKFYLVVTVLALVFCAISATL